MKQNTWQDIKDLYGKQSDLTTFGKVFITCVVIVLLPAILFVVAMEHMCIKKEARWLHW